MTTTRFAGPFVLFVLLATPVFGQDDPNPHVVASGARMRELLECALFAAGSGDQYSSQAVSFARYALRVGKPALQAIAEKVRTPEGQILFGPLSGFMAEKDLTFYEGMAFSGANLAVKKWMDEVAPFSDSNSVEKVKTLRALKSAEEFQKRDCKISSE